MKVFSFNPKEFSSDYSNKGFVHIPSGISAEFLEFAQKFTDDALATHQEKSLAQWAFKGKKSQFLFEFPESVNFKKDVKDVVGDLGRLDRDKVRLCERHIKVYNENAPATPAPHKDRVASEVTVGIPLKVPDNSHIILYPNQCREINPFASTAQHRASLDDNALPENVLAGVDPEILRVWPGDVVFFKGSSIYHERMNPANTSLLYLKFNGMNLDPLGEDPSTTIQREASVQALDDLRDEALLKTTVGVSPRLENINRQYSRLYWKELLQFNIWDQPGVSVSEYEFNLVRVLGHEQMQVADLLRRSGADGAALYEHIHAVRRLVHLGAFDLVFPENVARS